MNYDYIIGIPFYEDAVHLRRLLDSLESQEVDFKFKVLIYDDASPTPLNLTNSYTKFEIEINRGSKNLGPGQARNKLIKIIETDYIMLVDSDCCLNDQGVLQELYDKRMSADITYPNIYEQAGRLSQVIHPMEDQKYPTMTTCFQMKVESIKKKRIKFRQVFDFFCEDFCFFIECRKRGLSFKHLANLTINHQRPTTGHCPVRMTNSKRLNLVKAFFIVRIVHYGYVQSKWYTLDHIKKIIKNNKSLFFRDSEYSSVITAIIMFPLYFHKILILKVIYFYEYTLLKMRHEL